MMRTTDAVVTSLSGGRYQRVTISEDKSITITTGIGEKQRVTVFEADEVDALAFAISYLRGDDAYSVYEATNHEGAD